MPQNQDTSTDRPTAVREHEVTPCEVCGDTWKAPDGSCYSCWEEQSYKADCDHYNIYGWSNTHGGKR